MNQIKTEPFQKMRLDEEKSKDKSKVIPVRLNLEEIEMLENAKKVLECPMDGTVLKDLAKIGFWDVLHDKKTKYILGTVFKNKRNNIRKGISDFD